MVMDLDGWVGDKMKKNILIVDDEPDLRNLVKMALEEAGYHVVTAMDGDDCLEKLNGYKPDLILMDVMMPGTPVGKIVSQIKNTKIAYLSIVKTSDMERERLLGQDNVVDYIQKSFDIDELIARVGYLLSESKLDIKKEMEGSRTMLVMIPYVDYNAMVAEVVSQIYARRICYVTLNKTYGLLKDFFDEEKISTVNMVFVDGITRTVINTKNSKSCFFVRSPGALDELNNTISELLHQNFNYLIFDSVSDLLSYRGIDEVEQFVNSIIDLLVENRCKGIFYAMSRHKYAKGNRFSEVMYPEGIHKRRELLVEDRIFSIDKVVDLRKKCIKSELMLL